MKSNTATTFIATILFALACAHCAPAATDAATPMRPATVTWGGVRNNEQIAGSEAQWPFVAKYMDAFFMHGAYWLLSKDPECAESLKTLGQILQKNGKTAHLETGFGETESYDPSTPQKRTPYKRAVETDIPKFQEFRDKYGIDVSKVRVDWFPMPAMGVYAKYYKTTDMRKLMAMVTGAKEFGPVEGFDMKNAHWVDYNRELQAAFPKMEIAFDQALCNHGPVSDPELRKLLPWQPFGYGYKRKLSRHNGEPIMLDGKQVEISFDFADQLNGVISSSRDNGFNFVGFEGDTPFNYYSANLPAFPNDGLVQYLMAVERYLHQHNLKSARIINDTGEEYGDSDGGWIRVDLGTVQEIDRVRLVWGADFGQKAAVTTSTDGKIWSIVRLFNDPVSGVSEAKFKPLQARFLKVDFRLRGTPNGYQVAELEAYGPAQPGVNVALNHRATASSVNPAHPSAGEKRGIIELVDGNPNTYWESNYISNDRWDMLYHDRTLQYLEFYQAAGGRADEYIAESWYSGPFTFFPETKPGTFTNLARDLIRRIKGIDDDGSLMKAELAIRVNGHEDFRRFPKPNTPGAQELMLTVKPGETREIEVLITNRSHELNKGDARATPLLRVEQQGVAPFQIVYATPDGKDITEQVLCRGVFDGFFAGGLEPGESRTIMVKVTRPVGASGAAAGTIVMNLYWNPQDPQATVRDSVAVHLQ